MANPVEKVVQPVDRWQQRHRGTAFVYAVIKKYGDDRGGNLTALITYYAFVSIFPLLLLLVTVLGFVLQGHPHLQQQVRTSAFNQIKVLPIDISAMKGSGLALVVGLVGLLWGALGVSQAIEFAITEAWNVPNDKRRGYLPRMLRALAFFGVLGIGLVATTALTSLGSVIGRSLVAGVLGVLLSIVVSLGLFLWVFVLMGPDGVSRRDHLPGAVVAAIGWQVLQTAGVHLVQRNLTHASKAYGSIAAVLGLISFLSLASSLVMYSVELNVVRQRRMWPRSILGPATVPAVSASASPEPAAV